MSTHQAGASSQTSVGGSQPSAGQASVRRAAPSKAAVVTGYACAVPFPLVSFIIGAVLAIKYKGSASNPGTGIMVTAVAVFLVSLALILAAGSGA